MDTPAQVCEALRARLLGLRDPETGAWTGELASSALSTALAAVALADGDEPDRRLAAAGAAWLAARANADGGWGDTPESPSNLSTTLIAAAALRRVAGRESQVVPVLERADVWLGSRLGGPVAPEPVARALRGVYGSDRTFAVPILAFLAICGKGGEAWPSVPPLPFLLALLPQRLYRFFRLQVVSYALPALIAVGLCRHVCAARARGGWVWGRLVAGPLLRRLVRLQPAHGGFLDAIPLTAFVCLALRQAGYGEHAVARRGLDFLRRSARADRSWAIDSNLRTWVTTLATRALFSERSGRPCAGPDAERIAEWLVRTQQKAKHPFTGAQPGGWAWTDLPGGVPDADDTAGALIALKRLKEAGCRTEVAEAARNGVRWLLDLQNADGGMPTFCRGWGRLPFDRSCPDISAHALAALTAWTDESSRAGAALSRLVSYLAKSQKADGSWLPLWFGHQEGPGGKNPVIGTARVVDALREVVPCETTTATDNMVLRARMGGTSVRSSTGKQTLAPPVLGVRAPSGSGERSGTLAVGRLLEGGERWLLDAQRKDGGWGMGREATVEETALAVTALAGGDAAGRAAARRGVEWLTRQGAQGLERAAPIGLYFALLWYHERLYPLVWALEAIGRNSDEKEETHVG